MKQIKRFILQALLACNGPMQDTALDDLVKAGLPRPLQSDIDRAKRELETAKYISGDKHPFDETLTWTLTLDGRHQAKQL